MVGDVWGDVGVGGGKRLKADAIVLIQIRKRLCGYDIVAWMNGCTHGLP